MIKSVLGKPIRNNKGFTLTELIVAMAVFSFAIAMISVTFINLVRLQQRSAALRTAQDNSRRALEEMVRHAREASAYNTRNCSGSIHLFLDFPEGNFKYFTHNDGRLYRKAVGSSMSDCDTNLVNPVRAVPITAPDVYVLRFVPATSQAEQQSVALELSVGTRKGDSGELQNAGSTSVSCRSDSSPQCAVATFSTVVSVRGTGDTP